VDFTFIVYYYGNDFIRLTLVHIKDRTIPLSCASQKGVKYNIYRYYRENLGFPSDKEVEYFRSTFIGRPLDGKILYYGEDENQDRLYHKGFGSMNYDLTWGARYSI
jgi:hypothetical protein